MTLRPPGATEKAAAAPFTVAPVDHPGRTGRKGGPTGATLINKAPGGTMYATARNDGGDKLPGEPYPGPHLAPTPDGGPGVPNPPKAAGQ
ncbi:hypothetical protein [Streptomyces decoyicus]|uniref:hypothetical protein n=1 Tax=Streptomyces decoyicus TaxID=249567 RepID=UPI00386F6F68